MAKKQVELVVEVTKSPRGMLTHGAQISGTVDLRIIEKKPKIEGIYLEFLEVWNDASLVALPNQKKYFATPPVPRMVGEPYLNFNDRVQNGRKFGDYFHYIVHERIQFIEDQEKKVLLSLKPGDVKKWPFLLTLPAKWTCENPTGNWRFEIVCFLTEKTSSNILVVPVEGSRVKPSWYFEPIKAVVEAGGAAEGNASSPKEQFSQPQLGYVGSFTVVP
ncbi:MAG TPA: hypothetical protein VKK79_08020 [Candidatus Lokiarchaeia archaeon]|nr:hypothetical protein [Candidatus Lokiarchaeia archaeon]